MRIMMAGRQILFVSGSMLSMLLASCVATKSASEMRRIQEAEDGHADPRSHEAVWYAGSTGRHHYLWHRDVFFRHLNDWRLFRVSRSELKLDGVTEKRYDGSKDHDEKSMRYAAITKGPPYKLQRWATSSEREDRFIKEVRTGERDITIKSETLPDGGTRTSIESAKVRPRPVPPQTQSPAPPIPPPP